MFLLVVFAFAVFWLVKWLVGRIERQTTISEERIERQTKLLEGLFKEANESRIHVAETMSKALSENASKFEACTSRMNQSLSENTEFVRRVNDMFIHVAGRERRNE